MYISNLRDARSSEQKNGTLEYWLSYKIELDHLAFLKSEAPKKGEGPLTSLDRIDFQDKKRRAAELEERKQAPLGLPCGLSSVHETAHRSPASPKAANAQLDPIGRKAKKDETRDRLVRSCLSH